MSFRLDNEIALVTGASRGIGQAIALALGRAGAQVIGTATTDEGAAKKAENNILALWLESGSDTVDLLMSWSLKAIEDKDYGLALDFLDRIVTMRPDYAEGWNKRATVFYLTDDYSQSIADIKRALIIEPRHFGALSGLGSILHEIGDDKTAIEVYDQALALDPYLDNVKKALGEIHKDTDGKDI